MKKNSSFKLPEMARKLPPPQKKCGPEKKLVKNEEEEKSFSELAEMVRKWIEHYFWIFEHHHPKKICSKIEEEYKLFQIA